MPLQHRGTHNVSAAIGWEKIPIICEHTRIRRRKLPVRREHNHHINLLVRERLIFQPDIEIDRAGKIQPIRLAERRITIRTLKKIVLRTKDKLRRGAAQIRLGMQIILLRNLTPHGNAERIVEAVHPDPTHRKTSLIFLGQLRKQFLTVF